MSFITAFKALYPYLKCCEISSKIKEKVATSRLTPGHTHTSSSPTYSQFMESSPDSGSVLLGFRKLLSTLCLFIHMLIGFYKKQWTDQSHDGTSYNPATTYPGHTLSLLLPFTPPLLSYLHFKGLVLRRVADSTVLWCLIVMEMYPWTTLAVGCC